jgi:predicted deacetylase
MIGLRAPAYLIRFDDVCPTMNWAVWDRVERHLDRLSIKPLVAIVPDNQDPHLQVGEARANFWERARGWAAKGWGIGLHGHQHRYTTTSAGLLGLNRFSEFAGVPLDEQRTKLRDGLAILQRHGLRPSIWVAPGHSFDEHTLAALDDVGVRCVSDGFAVVPFRDTAGRLWIPQQLWRFRSMPLGLWTVCLHPNAWTPRDIERFERDTARFAPQIATWSVVTNHQWPRFLRHQRMLIEPVLRAAVRRRAALARVPRLAAEGR